jgi:hypothetical protein
MAVDQAQMPEYAKQYGQLVARAWGDEAFKQRLLAEPAAVLAEQGIALPPGMEVRLHEDTSTLFHLTLPPPSEDPSDEESGPAPLAPSAQPYLRLAARARADAGFKRRLLAAPAAVLAEEGIAVPPGAEVRVHESTPTLAHLALPPRPGDELSDEQLDAVAGGDTTSTAGSIGTFFCPVTTIGTAGTAGCLNPSQVSLTAG